MPPKSKFIRSRIKINLKIKRLFNISFSNKESTNCDIREIAIVIIFLEKKLHIYEKKSACLLKYYSERIAALINIVNI
ncbi:hypothetical protein BpHYR1_003628 [Brachionus plicatilis]|uniref:Uncharacterized protein n=1 Tax=Brachionus plicatilis TaxID=10195 RepID=A0A3M7PD81_BRAPC|nr:hypothetical protein BpHYR1_003628 [Brachionus plicatilis]